MTNIIKHPEYFNIYYRFKCTNLGVLYKEEFKSIIAFPDYLVSSFGRVMSIKYAKTTGRTKILKPSLNTYGYRFVYLYRHGGNMRQVHRLVASVFIQNPDLKPQVNHLSGKKSDNRYFMLEWATQSENMKHAFKIGLIKPRHGIKSDKCKLSEKDVIKIRFLINAGRLHRVIANQFSIAASTVSAIATGRNWKHFKSRSKEEINRSPQISIFDNI